VKVSKKHVYSGCEEYEREREERKSFNIIPQRVVYYSFTRWNQVAELGGSFSKRRKN
jgi:hypothetical protein